MVQTNFSRKILLIYGSTKYVYFIFKNYKWIFSRKNDQKHIQMLLLNKIFNSELVSLDLGECSNIIMHYQSTEKKELKFDTCVYLQHFFKAYKMNKKT